MPRRKATPQVRRAWWLKRADQAAVASFVGLALLALAGYWTVRGRLAGRLIEIDDAAPLAARFEVDINEAEWPELAQLPDIGETLARRIVESRATSGPFRDHEDLRRVRGIGPRTLERIEPYLRPLPGGGTVAGP